MFFWVLFTKNRLCWLQVQSRFQNLVGITLAIISSYQPIILPFNVWKVSVYGVILLLIFRIRTEYYSVRMREIGDQNNSKYWHFLRTYYHQSAQCCRWDKLSKCQTVLRSEIFCDISTKLIKTSHLIFPFCLLFLLNSVLCFTLALYVPIWLFRSFRKIWLFSNNMNYFT